MKLLLTLSLFCLSSFSMYSSDHKAFPSDCLVECQDKNIKSSTTPKVRFDLLRPEKIIEDLKKMTVPDNHQGPLQIEDFDEIRKACALIFQEKSFTMAYPYSLPGLRENYNDCFVLGKCLEQGLELETQGISRGSTIVRPSPFMVVNGFVILFPPQIDSFLYYAKMYQNHLPLCHKLIVLQRNAISKDEAQIENSLKKERQDLLDCTACFSKAMEAQILITNHKRTIAQLQQKDSKEFTLANISLIRGPLFSQFYQLEEVAIYFSNLEDGASLRSLQNIQSLKSVYLQDCAFKDFAVFEDLKNIKGLTFDRVKVSSEDITPIATLTQLSALGMLGFKQLNSIKSLTPLVNLTYLSISDSTVHDLKPFSGHPHLKILDIRNTSVTDITPLLGCLSLTQVVMSAGSIDSQMFNVLAAHLLKNEQKQQAENAPSPQE